MTMLTSLWTKAYGYILAAGALLVAVFTIYLRGRSDANQATERRVLGKDLENRKVGDAIRGDVALADDPAKRLQRWQRPGG